MKELVDALVAVAIVVGGVSALKGFHDVVRRAALEKAAQGLPSLTGMSRKLQQTPETRTREERNETAK